MSDTFVDPAGLDPAAADPAAEPQWGGPSQDEWGQVMGYVAEQQAQQQAYQQAQEQQASQQAQPQQYPNLDPFDENFSQQAVELFRSIQAEQLAPLQQWQQTQQLGEAENRAYDILDDIVSREGEFLDSERAFPAVISRAQQFYGEEASKHGDGPRAAEAALTRAASEQRAYEKAVADAAVARHNNQLTTLSGAATEPGSSYGIPGAQQRTVPDYRQGGSVADRIFGN